MNPAYIVEATCDAAADLESEPRPSTAVTLADGVATSDEREADAAPLAPTAAHASGCAISGAERGSALALLAALPLLLRRRRHG